MDALSFPLGGWAMDGRSADFLFTYVPADTYKRSFGILRRPVGNL